MGKLDFLNFFLSIVNHKTKTVSVMSAMSFIKAYFGSVEMVY